MLNTGILNINNLSEAIFFNDNTCPKCEGILKINSKLEFDNNIDIRYECDCGFICPILIDFAKNIKKPGYDNTVKNFIKEFDIKDNN